jgi:hypothetical protein
VRPIPRWQHQYLGLSALPRILGQIEIEAFFSFSAHEIGLIRSPYKQNHRIAAAIQVGFLRMTGRLMQAVGAIPSPLLKHVGAQLGAAVPSIASLRTIYRRRSTLFEHQARAMKIAGFQRATDRQLSRLLPFLRVSGRSMEPIGRTRMSRANIAFTHSVVLAWFSRLSRWRWAKRGCRGRGTLLRRRSRAGRIGLLPGGGRRAFQHLVRRRGGGGLPVLAASCRGWR